MPSPRIEKRSGVAPRALGSPTAAVVGAGDSLLYLVSFDYTLRAKRRLQSRPLRHDRTGLGLTGRLTVGVPVCSLITPRKLA